jgi:hypothetical protein
MTNNVEQNQHPLTSILENSIMKKILLLASMALAVSGKTQATIIYSEDFNANNGGYTATTYNPLNSSNASGPWIYGVAAGVGSTGGWSSDGADGLNSPFEQLLTSPLITLSAAGAVNLSFEHQYNFEYADSLYWDGGLVQISVNGGVFMQVPTSSFTLNGYSATLQDSFDWGYSGDMNALAIFGGTSGGSVPAKPPWAASTSATRCKSSSEAAGTGSIVLAHRTGPSTT